MHFSFAFLFLLLLYLLFCLSSATPGLVGVTFRPMKYNVLPISDVCELLKKQGVPRVRLIDPEPSDIEALASSGILISISIKDQETLSLLSSNETTAGEWTKNILSSAPAANITTISLGYNILLHSPDLTGALLNGLKYVREAVRALGFPEIAITTSHSFNVITGVAAPSTAVFKSNLRRHMSRLLDYLNKTNAPFEVELFPYVLYKAGAVPGTTLKFAMFEADIGGEDIITDEVSGRQYVNLYQMMFESVMNALRNVSYGDLLVEVVGTGWPWRPMTEGGSGEREADTNYAGEYNDRLITMVNSGDRKRRSIPTYIHSLYDSDWYTDDEPYKAFMGVLEYDSSKRYSIDWRYTTNNEDSYDNTDESSAAAVAELRLCTFFLAWLLLSFFFL